MSDTTLQAALVTVLAEMPNPVKNADNPAFKRNGIPMRYADLEATLDACKPILAANGIAVMQHPVSRDGGLGVHTWLIGHGEVMDCGEFVLPLEAQNPQKGAGAITYARRYALTSLFGLAQEDDDANAASAKAPAPAAKKPEPQGPSQAEQITALVKKHGHGEAVKAKMAEWKVTANKAGYDSLAADAFDELAQIATLGAPHEG